MKDSSSGVGGGCCWPPLPEGAVDANGLTKPPLLSEAETDAEDEAEFEVCVGAAAAEPTTPPLCSELALPVVVAEEVAVDVVAEGFDVLDTVFVVAEL